MLRTFVFHRKKINKKQIYIEIKSFIQMLIYY